MENAQGRFLVLDDEAVVRHSFGRVLTEAGYEVDAVETGTSALEALRKERYDGLFADIKMPGMDGIDVTKLVRETRPEVPIMIVTGYPSSQTAREAVELGALMYQSKPVTPDRLLDMASTALEVSKSRVMAIPSSSELEDERAKERPAAPTLSRSATEADDAEEPKKQGVLKSLGLLMAAPLIGGAYVLLMPFVAVFVLGALGLKAMGLKLEFLDKVAPGKR